MAELDVDGAELVLRLSAAEKLEGVHGDLRAPLAAVQGIEVLEDAHAAVGPLASLRIGTRIPGIVEVGTIIGRKRRLFAAVHHDTPRGLRVKLGAEPLDEWIVGCADPEAAADRVRALIGRR